MYITYFKKRYKRVYFDNISVWDRVDIDLKVEINMI